MKLLFVRASYAPSASGICVSQDHCRTMCSKYIPRIRRQLKFSKVCYSPISLIVYISISAGTVERVKEKFRNIDLSLNQPGSSGIREDREEEVQTMGKLLS